MKLIKPSYEIIEQQPGLEGMFKHIEVIGRVCYKSEDKITKDSYKTFVEMLKGRKHGAMLEHGTVYLSIPQDPPVYIANKYRLNRYSEVKEVSIGVPVCITTNYRVLVENDWLDDLKYWSEPTEHHIKRHSVRFICDRGVSHEFVRNRGSKGNAFAQESTRYCNYSKDKYGNEVTFIHPPKEWFYLNSDATDSFINFSNACVNAEVRYLNAIDAGWTPQQARAVLPNSLKTELVMTCYDFDWKHFLSLRTDKAAHPQAQELAYPLKEEFERRGWL